MNALVQYDPSVPAFLRNENLLALAQKATAGLSMGAPPRLSFRGSRFRWVAADGTETPLPADGQPGNNSISVDVVVLDASQHVSKFYYDKQYDPNADDLSPACFSDNGVGPSVRATKPQSLLCQACPHNAWGSKVTPQGTQVKACSDVKKLAIIPVSNITGPAYTLAIPGASLKGWTGAVNTLSQRGVPIPAVVFRLGFDPDPAFPKLTFTLMRYITEQEYAAVQDLFGSDELVQLVGGDDKAIAALPAYTGGAGSVTQAAPQPAPAPVQAPFPSAAQQASFPGPQAAPAPVQAPFPGQATAATATPTQAAAPRRRGRPPANPAPAAEMSAAPVQQTATASAPVFTQPAPAAPVAAAPAGAQDLNALLDAVMAGGAR